MENIQVETTSTTTPTPSVKAGDAARDVQLIPCPFCAEDINAAAKKCKHCGEFLDKSARKVGTETNIVTIQKTGKKWKKRKLWALGMFLGGVIISPTVPGLGMLLVFGGLGMAIFTKIGTWWDHG